MKRGIVVFWDDPSESQDYNEKTVLAVCNSMKTVLETFNHSLLANQLPQMKFTIFLRDETDLPKTGDKVTV